MLASRRAAHCRVRPGAILQQPVFGVFWGRGGGWLEPPWSGRTFQSWEIPAPSFLLDLASMLNKSHPLTGEETNAVFVLERTSKWGWRAMAEQLASWPCSRGDSAVLFFRVSYQIQS